MIGPLKYTHYLSESDPRLNGSKFAAGRTDRKHGAVRPQKPLRLIRDGEVGGSGISYLTSTRYTVTTRMILH